MSTKKHPLAGRTLKCKVWLAICTLHLDSGLMAVFTFDPSVNDPDWLVIGTKEVEHVVPDDFDPTAAQVAAVLAEKERLTTEFTKAVSELNRRLSELQAIGFTPAAEEAGS